MFEGEDFQKEFDNLSYINLSENIINILTKSLSNEDGEIKDKNMNLKKECFDLLIIILSCNKQVLENYKKVGNDEKKNNIIELFKNKFCEDDSKNKDIFMQNILNSVTCAEKNNNLNYIEFLSNLVNKLLDSLINTGNTIESPEDNIQNKNKFAPDNSFF